MHFCLPAQLMKLVEMSPGLRTSEETFQAAWDFCKAMGQIPVKTKDNPGFILNYFLIPFNNDAIRMVEAGVAAPADIDRAIKTGLGYAMGPLELLDLVGPRHAPARRRGALRLHARPARRGAGAGEAHDRGGQAGPQDGRGFLHSTRAARCSERSR